MSIFVYKNNTLFKIVLSYTKLQNTSLGSVVRDVNDRSLSDGTTQVWGNVFSINTWVPKYDQSWEHKQFLKVYIQQVWELNSNRQ